MMKTLDDRWLTELRESCKEYSIGELVAWRKHIQQNPYSELTVSQQVIELLTEVIDEREKGIAPIPIPHTPYP